MQENFETGRPTNMNQAAANNVITNGAYRMLGVIVASSNNGALRLFDGPNNSARLVLNTMNLNAGQFIRLPLKFQNAPYVEIANTADVTFVGLTA